MAKPIYKILMIMKKRPGMSTEDFRDYYETRHAPLGEKYSQGILRYIRRYVEPQNRPETGMPTDLPDVITELWFDDEAVYKATLAHVTTNVMPDEVIEDEKKLFDRDSLRVATVVELESDFPGKPK